MPKRETPRKFVSVSAALAVDAIGEGRWTMTAVADDGTAWEMWNGSEKWTQVAPLPPIVEDDGEAAHPSNTPTAKDEGGAY